MRQIRKTRSDGLRPEYDLRQLPKGAARGEYAKSYHANSNVVMLDPDLHDVFRDARAVNDALRLVIELSKVTGRTRISKNGKPKAPGSKTSREVLGVRTGIETRRITKRD